LPRIIASAGRMVSAAAWTPASVIFLIAYAPILLARRADDEPD